MFFKSKICFTVFSLYEIAAAFVLHYPATCDPMFGGSFCMTGLFKYFVGMVAVPLLAYLIYMWIREIVVANHRRHSFAYRAKDAVEDIWSNVRESVTENVSRADIEKYLTAGLLIGVKKYAQKHPDLKAKLKSILDNTGLDMSDIVSDDMDDMENMHRASRTVKVTRATQKSASAKRKK